MHMKILASFKAFAEGKHIFPITLGCYRKERKPQTSQEQDKHLQLLRKRHPGVSLMNRKEQADVATAKTPNHQQEKTLSLDLCQTTSVEMRPEFD